MRHVMNVASRLAAIGLFACAAACNTQPPPLQALRASGVTARGGESTAGAPSVNGSEGSLAPTTTTGARASGSMPSPPHGVLKAGEADAVVRSGAPSRIRLLGPGVEPRAALAYTLPK